MCQQLSTVYFFPLFIKISTASKFSSFIAANDTVSNHNLETEQSSVANESSIKEDNIETNSCNDFQRERNNGDEIESIYLDDGSHVKKPATVNKPQRKLTKVCV